VLDVKRISIFLSEPQVDAFQKLSAESGRPYAELIREALDAYLRDKGRTHPAKSKTERPRAVTRKRS